MNKEKEFMDYDDDKAVKFIRNYISQELKEKLSDDDIIYFLDLIADYYESRGYMDMDEDDDTIIDIDEDELVEYVVKNACRDEVGVFSEDEIRQIIRGEFGYCESLGIFE